MEMDVDENSDPPGDSTDCVDVSEIPSEQIAAEVARFDAMPLEGDD